jgi:hypothetical protein
MATKKREKQEGKPKAVTPEQAAAIGRLTAFAATHGSLLASDNLFPYLNPAGFRQESDTASERLVDAWSDSPLVTLGHDGGVSIAWMGRAELNIENKRLALGNLRSRRERAEWQAHSMESPAGPIELFVRMGDDLTASDLVDPDFLRAAYEQCGSKVVFFAIPSRVSMVMASHPDPVARVARVGFEDDEHDPVSSCLFAFNGEGALVPMIPQIQQDA